MTAPPVIRVPMPVGPKLAIMQVGSIPPHFYRYLYEQVGKPHHWMMRRSLNDEQLAGALHRPETQIEVLYVDGAPAGFFELDLFAVPESVEIVYFGLIPDFQGRGLARFFLSAAIFAAWSHDPGKVTIHTNTLDSPRALQIYQKMGFVPVAWSEEDVVPWI
ncbi:GNAT family N-acetyltransferase [Mesorhizobium xinjiangense]|uniref:GNAT family N-acetyltransferase n=1 Tax=Mesorhizobium xinjiangense TaxID=2678685 RepID=UPI001F3E2CA3|nr:GNAT family N-acetyltransferase [Mesorhizobium xinjiangense]